jgi:ABC-type transport system substrate-binding protein
LQQLASDTLWFINPEGGKDAWQNALAAEPPIYNDDATQMTVRLRRGIYWSDGVEFTADDVAYTVQTQIDHPGMNWSAAFSINVAGIEVQVLVGTRRGFHQQRSLARAEFVEASAGLLMINASTSIPGPLLASALMSAAGPSALFLFTALAHAAMAFYAFTRISVRGAAPAETRDIFTPVPQGSPASLPLDPRAPEQKV